MSRNNFTRFLKNEWIKKMAVIPFADKESNWGQKSHNAHHGRKVAGTGIHVENTHLLSKILHKKPSGRWDAAKNDYGEKLQKKNDEINNLVKLTIIRLSSSNFTTFLKLVLNATIYYITFRILNPTITNQMLNSKNFSICLRFCIRNHPEDEMQPKMIMEKNCK